MVTEEKSEILLANGYTELTVIWVLSDPPPCPSVCVSCANPLQESDIGSTEVLKSSAYYNYGEPETRKLEYNASICKQCASICEDITKIFYVELGRIDGWKPAVVFQIAYPAVAKIFEEFYRKACPEINAPLMAAVKEEGVDVGNATLAEVASCKRLAPGEEDWKKPGRRSGCLAIILAAIGLVGVFVFFLTLAISS